MNYIKEYRERSESIQNKCIKNEVMTLGDRQFIYWHGLYHESMLDYSEEELIAILSENRMMQHPGCVYLAADKSRDSIPLKNALVMCFLRHPSCDIVPSEEWKTPESWVLQDLYSETVNYGFKHAYERHPVFFEPRVLLPHFEHITEYEQRIFFENEPEWIVPYLNYIFTHHVNYDYIWTAVRSSPSVWYPHIKSLIIHYTPVHHSYPRWFELLELLLEEQYDKDVFELFNKYHYSMKETELFASVELIQDPHLKKIGLHKDLRLELTLCGASQFCHIDDWHPDNLDILAFECYFNQYRCAYDGNTTFDALKDAWKHKHSLLSYQECRSLLAQPLSTVSADHETIIML